MYRVILPIAAGLTAATLFIQPAHSVEVYLFKGAGDFSFISENLHFSRGLQRIADTLNSEGIHAELRGFSGTGDALATIRQRRPESVAFIGHSMGALASLSMARQMRQEGIRVAYIGLIDIPGPVGVAGDNVQWAENYYSIYPVYGRLTNADTHPNAHNIHVFGQIHTTMDDSRKVRTGMLAALRQIQANEQNLAPQPDVLMVENSPVYVPPATASGLPPIDADPQYYPQPVDNQVLVYDPAINQQPMALPSVGQQTEVVMAPTPQAQDPGIDRTTTGSVVVNKVVDTGRNLIGKVRGYLARINHSRMERARSYER